MSIELADVNKAVAEFDKVAAGLAQLQQTYGDVIYPVTTTAGMDDAKAARLALREPRYEVERVRKNAKAPIIELGKKLDAEAARITTELLKIEKPIDDQIKAEEARKEAEKQARIVAEQKRVAEIQDRITELRNAIATCVRMDSEQLAEVIKNFKDHPIDDSYAEFKQSAEDAKAATLLRLREMHDAAIEREAAAVRLTAEREELARLRAAEERRQSEARERQIAEQQRLDHERAEQQRKDQEAQAARQAELDREAADLAAQKAEQDRQAQEIREANEAEAKRLADERTALEQQQEQQRQADAQREADRIAALTPAPAPAPAATARKRRRPSNEEIIKAVATFFETDIATAARWIRELRAEAA